MLRNLLIMTITLLFIVPVVNAVNVVVEESNNTRTVVRFEIEDYTTQPIDINGDTYYQINVDGESNLLNKGEPSLPRICRSIIIPNDASMEIEVISSEYVDIPDMAVAPSKGNLLRTVDPEKVPYTFGSVFQSSDWYPSNLASIRKPHIQRDFRGTVIDLNSFQYNAEKNTLRVYTSVTVEVKNIGPSTENVLTRVNDGIVSDFEMIYKRRYINYDLLASRYTSVGEIGDLLIITHDLFADAMAPLVEWKQQKGIHTTIVNISAIGNNSTAIGNYIQNLYNTSNLAFVLLVGDAAQIASPYSSGGSSDPSYAKVAGSDHYPDIFIGRFSAENIPQVTTQVERTLTYEMNPPGADWFHKGTGVGSNQGPGHFGEYDDEHLDLIRDKLLAYNYTHVDQIYDYSGTAAMVTAALNEGRGIINYCGHGSTTSWSSTGYSNTHVNNLTNDNKLPFIISVACVNGDFAAYTCFAEAWMRASHNGAPTGAIGTYMSSINQSWDPPMDAQDEVVDLLVADEKFTYGGLCYNGSCKMIDINGSGGVSMYDTWHIFGDPSVMVWSNDPAPMTVNHDDIIIFGPSEFDVQVVGVEGALCAFYKDGTIYGTGYTDASGNCTITFDTQPIPGDELTLTVTSYNGLPYITPLMVISPEGAYVVYNDDSYNDVNGNDNDILEAGENILLGLELKNIGPDEAIDVNATVTSPDQYITMTDNTEAYGSILGGDATSFIADGFSFDVSSDAPDGYIAPFNLEVTGTNRDLWTGGFSLEIHKPVVDFLTVTINDIGNSDGVLDPGESADLIVTLANSGSGQATNATAILSESDAYVSISDNYGTYGLIEEISGMTSNSTDVYTVSADGGCTPGHEMVFNLSVTADNGYTANLTFDFIVGDRMSFFVDDFSTNQGWIGIDGSKDAEWTIGPATGGTGSDGSGASDPLYDHTPTEDNGVLGNDLTSGIGGDYSNNLNTQYYAYSPVIDCGDFTSTQLTYYRCLGIESSDHVKLQVFDGEDWVTLFQNTSTINETAWTEQFHNVASYADGNNSFQVRYSLGTTDNSSQYCGWNIDDFSLKGYDQSGGVSALMSMDNSEVADSMAEGGTALRSVHVDNNGDGELRIRFNSEASWIVCSNDLNYVNPSEGLDFEFSFDATGMVPGDYYSTLNYTSNDFDNMAGSIPLSLHIYAPTCDIPATSISRSLSAGDSIGVPVTIYNNGPGRLTYSIGCQTFDPSEKTSNSGLVASDRELIGYQNSSDDKNDQSPLYASSDRGHGGPDVYGYSWIDSDDPGGPAFAWVDISATGTVVDLGDDNYSSAIDIGFAFPWYENEYTQLYISSNGIITFGSGNSSRYNSFFPDTAAPNNMISMWWDDLDPEEYGNVYYYHDVSTGRFIVSFDGVPNYQYPDGTGSLNFQAILYPNGKVTLQYGTMDPGSDAEGLTSSSIGIENAAGDDGLEAVYNAAYMHDNMAIDFSVVRWLWVEPSGGMLEPFTNTDVTVNLCAFDLEDGVFEGQMSITTNDPLNPAYLLPVTVTIQDFICGDADGNGEGPLVTDLVFLVDYIFKGGPPPPVLAAGDANGLDGDLINVADLSYLVDYLFKGGPPPICH